MGALQAIELSIRGWRADGQLPALTPKLGHGVGVQTPGGHAGGWAVLAAAQWCIASHTPHLRQRLNFCNLLPSRQTGDIDQIRRFQNGQKPRDCTSLTTNRVSVTL